MEKVFQLYSERQQRRGEMDEPAPLSSNVVKPDKRSAVMRHRSRFKWSSVCFLKACISWRGKGVPYFIHDTRRQRHSYVSAWESPKQPHKLPIGNISASSVDKHIPLVLFLYLICSWNLFCIIKNKLQCNIVLIYSSSVFTFISPWYCL